VTHDQEEALEVADRIVLMNHGKIEQTGTPEEVFHRPATEFVLNFLGQVNLFRGRIEGGEAHIGAAAGGVAGSSPPGGEARVFVRPHDFDVDLAPRSKASFRARVRRINAAGAIAKLEVTSEVGDTVLVELPQDVYRALRLAVGTEVFLTPREVKVFTEDYSI
jgi:sulfate transport system ATP-binding protein